MKHTIYVAVIMFTIAISSCGPSAEEVAANQKRKDDSVANAVQQMTNHKDDSIAKAAQENLQQKQKIQSDIAKIKDDLEHAIADLTVANDEMNHVKEFHFGRTTSERDQQINDQSLKIQHLRDRTESLKNALSEQQMALAMFQ